jgi:hypothetical protein
VVLAPKAPSLISRRTRVYSPPQTGAAHPARAVPISDDENKKALVADRDAVLRVIVKKHVAASLGQSAVYLTNFAHIT